MIAMWPEWQFSYVFCTIDGFHLPIKCPDGGADSMKQYFNFKNFSSIVHIALVDARYQFIWASIGNAHDAMYFQSRNLWKHISEGDFIPEETCVVNNVNLPPIVLGDGAFPLTTWMMKPYGDAVPIPHYRYFNYRGSRGCLVTERTFGHLKSWFRVLHRKCESKQT